MRFSISNIRRQLKDFRDNTEDVDTEDVKQRTLKRVAKEMNEMVRLALQAEDDITTPSINSKYGQGAPGASKKGGQGRSKGYSMSDPRAWEVSQEGDAYVLRPQPRVQQRAVVLNYGIPGRITPNNSEYLFFWVDGVPVLKKSVDGPDPTHYWQAAWDMLQNSGRIDEIASEELEIEFEKSF